MGLCKYWKEQPDGFHGYCMHPDAQAGDQCILDIKEECILREE
jgi:hypothetical protein